MKTKLCLAVLAVAAVILALGGGEAYPSSTPSVDPATLTSFSLALFDALAEPVVDPLDPSGFFQVKPQEFDPGRTNLVQSAWLNGIGCPTNATIALPNTTFTGVGGFSTYTD